MTDNTKIPSHVGLILDGNRRWAKEHGLPTLEGHRQGYNNLKDITKMAVNRGVKYISAFVFSTENWNRTPKEVKYLMNLAYNMLTKDVAELNKENIKVLCLGAKERVSQKLQKAIASAEESTKQNTKANLAICFNYGGQQEIVDAAKKLIIKNADPNTLTPKIFANELYTPSIPQIDLLIRASGEQRTSGFMLWRAAYAELYFTDKYWPDFSEEDLDNALAEYSLRRRRFGK